MSEEFINVPLEPKDKAMLKLQAADNGRAMMREAAVLIRLGLKPRTKPRMSPRRRNLGGAK